MFLFFGCSKVDTLQLKPIEINSTEPSQISIFFQATIGDKAIPYLKNEDFLIFENGEQISKDISNQKLLKEVPLFEKNIIAIDISDMKDDEKNLIASQLLEWLDYIPIDKNREMMVTLFDENVYLLQDFTSDRMKIAMAIQKIPAVSSNKVSNLYDNYSKLTSLWSDEFSHEEAKTGSLILITNGGDKSGKISLENAKKRVGKKRVYVVGVGENADYENLSQLGVYWRAKNFRELEISIREIGKEMINYRDSFYLLSYLSPKRGGNNHTLTLKVAGYESQIRAKFDSSRFSSPVPDLQLKVDKKKSGKDRVAVQVKTLFGREDSEFLWKVEDQSVATMTIGTAGKEAIFYSPDSSYGKTEISVTDIGNRISKKFTLFSGVLKDEFFDFQENKFPEAFRSEGDEVWKLYKRNGNILLKSGDIRDGETSTLILDGDFLANRIAFKFRVSSEEGCDEFWFYIDDKGFYQSGEVPWSYIEYPITPGKHRLKWIYTKDGTNSKYMDSVWIDEVQIFSK